MIKRILITLLKVLIVLIFGLGVGIILPKIVIALSGTVFFPIILIVIMLALLFYCFWE